MTRASTKSAPTPPACGCCGEKARLTDGAEVYPHRPDLRDKPIWRCDACDAHVGCHPGTTRPLGTPADKPLRDARMKLHDLMLDPLWRNAPDHYGTPEDDAARGRIRAAARKRVYAFLAAEMGLDREACHTAMFSLEQCRDAWRALRGRTYPEVREWYLNSRNDAPCASAVGTP